MNSSNGCSSSPFVEVIATAGQKIGRRLSRAEIPREGCVEEGTEEGPNQACAYTAPRLALVIRR